MGLSLYYKWYKEMIIALGIITFHELCHGLIIIIFKGKINEIVLNPLGGSIKSSMINFSNSTRILVGLARHSRKYSIINNL